MGDLGEDLRALPIDQEQSPAVCVHRRRDQVDDPGQEDADVDLALKQPADRDQNRGAVFRAIDVPVHDRKGRLGGAAMQIRLDAADESLQSLSRRERSDLAGLLRKVGRGQRLQ